MVNVQRCAAGLTVEPLTTGPAIIYKLTDEHFQSKKSGHFLR